jgi:hypothetical protein
MTDEEENNLHIYLDELNEMIRLNRSYYRKVEQLCSSISDLYSEISTKMYKLGSLYSKIGDNAKTIEKYCFSNLKATRSSAPLSSRSPTCSRSPARSTRTSSGRSARSPSLTTKASTT